MCFIIFDFIQNILYIITVESEVSYIFLQKKTCPFMCKLVDLESESTSSVAELGLVFIAALV